MTIVALGHALRRLTPSLVLSACGGLPPERRSEMRRQVRVGCHVRRADGTLVTGDHSLDLSAAGMLLRSEAMLRDDEPLLVRFQATELAIAFETEATVARLVHGRRWGDAGRAVGLRFSSLPAVSRLVLRAVVGKGPGVPPRRTPPPELSPRPALR